MARRTVRSFETGAGVEGLAFASGYTLRVIWELVFMLVILKIPVVYLCWVVWWAVRAEPHPLEGAGRLASVEPRGPDCGWRRQRVERSRRGRPGPRGGARAGRPARLLHARGRLTS
jgi:hypothetical protein